MARFTNQAQLSYNGAVVNSNIAVGEIVEVLSVSKTAVTENYVRGGDVTYVISAVNSGSTPLTGVSITDDLGGYTFGSGTLYPLAYVDGSVRVYVNGVLQTSSPTVVEGPPIVFSGLTVPASGNLMLIYEARVNQFAPLGADDSIVNTAAVTASGITAPSTASATVTPDASGALTITKSIDPVSVTENGTVTYTFIIQNYGRLHLRSGDGDFRHGSRRYHGACGNLCTGYGDRRVDGDARRHPSYGYRNPVRM